MCDKMLRLLLFKKWQKKKKKKEKWRVPSHAKAVRDDEIIIRVCQNKTIAKTMDGIEQLVPFEKDETPHIYLPVTSCLLITLSGKRRPELQSI